MTSLSTVFFTEVASCVSVRFSPLLELEAPGVIAVSGGSSCTPSSPAGFSVGSSFSSSCTSGTAGGGARGSAAGGMSNVVDFCFCGVSTTARRFSSDQLCSAIRRTLRAYTTPSPSVLTRCSSVKSLLPSHTADFPPVGQLQCGMPRSFSHLWKMSKYRFTKLQHLFHDTDHPSHDRTGTLHRCS